MKYIDMGIVNLFHKVFVILEIMLALLNCSLTKAIS